ncbi:FAD-binding and (Fe-S)-binding domain-containing protein [Pikeienuella sp. HZG-20]|uniref:FAD-binding and (Fe-S)-binding domain-containing protein n=1 Tax=Paludibacillus litoralis TaxID=3133267 RepID=UPI0030ED3A05
MGPVNIEKLRSEIEGEASAGAFDRGRYATDASIYQIVPRAVVTPKRWEDVEATLAFAREAGVPVMARGGGTSQSGQTVNDAIVVDFSKHMNRVLDYDAAAGRVTVEPGLVLDELNRKLKKDRLWFPVDVSTASRATLGGMAANNSCGSRSIRYGKMRDNTLAIEAMLANGEIRHFGPVGRPAGDALFDDMLALGAREAEEIEARFPKVLRRVGGYNIDALTPNGAEANMAHLLVGSEGTLAISRRLELRLSPTLDSKTLGVCHFPSFYKAMDAAQHIVKLGPVAVELVDHNMIRLGRDIPQFKPIVDEFVRGAPAALLLVEFAEPDPAENRRRLAALGDLMAELGFRWGDPGKEEGGVVEAEDPAFQARIWGVRTQGLNIMMSMRTAGKPVSFVEDCAVDLEHLAEFTDRLTQVFHKHGTDGTWYAHASVGLLHVRPVLNLKEELGARQLRAIAEEAFEIVAEYKGAHSGEHGDGIVRSEFHERMYGSRIVRAFEEVKDRFDPTGLLNPGKIVRAPRMDDRSLFRTPPGYAAEPRETAFDWSAWPGGLTGAVEMCNNNGACRKLAGGAMCPSYRAMRNERDVTRGRANTLRLALTGQLGPDAFTSDDMMETMKFCVSCKSCKRECPMSVDMAKMKVEVLAARAKKYGVPLRERLIAYLPRYAPYAARVRWLLNGRDRIPGIAALSEAALGFSAKRRLPVWRKPFAHKKSTGDVLLFADTFNRYFEPENLNSAVKVLTRAGYDVGVAAAPAGAPLCCGRSYLSAGLVDKAKAEMRRSAGVFAEALRAGKTIVGLEPSCTLTFRDEAPVMIGDEWTEEMGRSILTFEEFIVREARAGRFNAPLAPIAPRALIHGHCHQKALGAAEPIEEALGLIPGLAVEKIESSCCGMAGSFGYQAETEGVSRAMAELSLAPAARAAPEDALIVADGTSCRHQIADIAARDAVHVARVFAMSVEAAETRGA